MEVGSEEYIANESIHLTSDLYNYLVSVSLREPELGKRLRAEIAQGEHSGMQMSPDEAQFLAFLVKLLEAKRIIEIGVFKGYSGLIIAEALPDDGRMIACDINADWTVIAQQYWQEAGVDHKIDLRLAPAMETLQALLDEGQAQRFDFILIDADKQIYDTYYEMGLQLLRPGGLIAIDNVLWHGDVIDETKQDVDTLAIRALNKKLYTDERVDLSLVPIGDGVTLVRKR